jgi:endonuclease III
MSLEPKILVKLVKESLKNKNIDFEKEINSFGQIHAVKSRIDGKGFTLQEHIKGLVYSLLSRQRVWKSLLPHLKKIDFVEINCGNMLIEKQMKALSDNIKILKKLHSYIEMKINEIYKHHNDIIRGQNIVEDLANRLTDPKSEDKLKQVGNALIMEYFKNIGVRSMKPDTHILRICGRKRLGILESVEDENTNNSNLLRKAQKEFIDFVNKISENVPIDIVYYDNLFWLFGAKEYGEICTKKPKCYQCLLLKLCNYKQD